MRPARDVRENKERLGKSHVALLFHSIQVERKSFKCGLIKFTLPFCREWQMTQREDEERKSHESKNGSITLSRI